MPRFATVMASTTLVLLLVPSAAVAEGAGADEDTLKLYKSQCATCHGADGKGQTTPGKRAGAKDWTDGKTLEALNDAAIEKIVREGVKGDDGKQKMPAFKKLSDPQVDALVKVLRSFQKK